MRITETKRKGEETDIIEKGSLLIYSGVKIEESRGSMC